RIIARVLALEEAEAQKELKDVFAKFAHRYHSFQSLLERQFQMIRRHLPSDVLPSPERRLLIGSLFLAEYSFESTALFNPSIVPHPDQSGMPKGSLRFIMSLRATGEGHISSLTFRSGSIDQQHVVALDPTLGFASTAEMKANYLYDKPSFVRKLREMNILGDLPDSIAGRLADEFTYEDLMEKVKYYAFEHKPLPQSDRLAADKIQWLALCNYEAHFDASVALPERVLFPLSPSEQNGIEDARFVLFTDDDGSQRYYATYTAYDGKAILPQLMETQNFEHFKMITLNGNAALNKGMALFPRKIRGRYAMVSRQDNENLFLMYSDNIHFWHEALPLMKPSYPWEFMQIGNCGSPMETEHGWLLLTHGVGPFRQYSIGAVLLDRDDPQKVIGRLREPLIRWTEAGRSGYVPNVVYTCGALIHNGTLVLPYAMSDRQTAIALVELGPLVERLIKG
ncbi:MAG: glycoside hydrolase family 130 protein, partial [Deltaproteobacteria bacterium]|nr:glycoside hydrolase family 130 protein [Deltaproteobacteria bacterium]